MNLEISIVPYGLLTQTVGSLMKYFTIAQNLTNGRSLTDDLVKLFYMGHYSLWVFYDVDTSSLVGFFAVEIKQYPQKRMLCVQHCTTEPGCLEDGYSKKLDDVLKQYAKANACAGVEFVGRLGWKKRWTKECGYTADALVFQTFFNEVAK